MAAGTSNAAFCPRPEFTPDGMPTRLRRGRRSLQRGRYRESRGHPAGRRIVVRGTESGGGDGCHRPLSSDGVPAFFGGTGTSLPVSWHAGVCPGAGTAERWKILVSGAALYEVPSTTQAFLRRFLRRERGHRVCDAGHILIPPFTEKCPVLPWKNSPLRTAEWGTACAFGWGDGMPCLPDPPSQWCTVTLPHFPRVSLSVGARPPTGRTDPRRGSVVNSTHDNIDFALARFLPTAAQTRASTAPDRSSRILVIPSFPRGLCPAVSGQADGKVLAA